MYKKGRLKHIAASTPSLSVGMTDGTPAPAEYKFSAGKNTQSFKIVSTDKWKVTIEELGIDWLEVTPSEGDNDENITITVDENKDTDKRTATLVFIVKGKEVKTFKVSQDGYVPNYEISVSSKDFKGISKAGKDITFTIHSNSFDWEYNIENNPSWVTEKKKEDSTLVLSIDKNSNEPREAKIKFALSDNSSFSDSISLSQQGQASMLDVQFNLDGSATDLSIMQHTVQKISHDFPFTVSYNSTYDLNMVTFAPEENGVSPEKGHGSWYQIDYQNNTDFQNKLADGHSFECLVQFDVDYTAVNINHETKFFSTQQSGGTGFVITKDNNSTGGNAIAFIPNVPATEGGSSTWRWANSKIHPEQGKWYHVVGIWDKKNGKASIYVNGKKAGEVNAAGYYRPSPYDESKWVAIGGDPGKGDYIQLPFAGKMLIARIYDEPLTEREVKDLWEQVDINK